MILRSRSRSGMALVITLSLIVLATITAVAFFTRATSNRAIESSRSNDVLAAQLAKTGADYVTSRFLNEITLGCNLNSTNSTGTYSQSWTANGTTIFRPINFGAAPQRNLVTSNMTSNSTFNNLVRQSSVAADSAENDGNGTATTSANGRIVGTATWSTPLLLNGSNTTSTPGNFTSVSNLPQWIYVGKNGSTGNISSTTSAGSTPSNVVGRFAYNVYDIGGLLDANVVGCPTSVSGNATLLKQIKDTLAGADLTAILGNSASANTTINNFISYRNPAYASSPTAYINYVLDAKKAGFISANASGNATALNNFFTNRQDLVRYAQSQNLTSALPYLTHFSRALEQPSFIPDPSRPKITPTTTPPASSGSYLGNNNYAGGDDIINLGNGGFLSVRVQNTFTRLNNSTALIGEPLVKTKFPLSYLALVTTNATATKSMSDPIYSRFGIYRSSPSSPWVYDHGDSTKIMTLNNVAAANREPDFAELLKAAIHAGSLAKAAPNSTNRPTPYSSNWQYPDDLSGDLQVLQIMANLIDQTKSDNFPTRIQINDGSRVRTAYGIQDLPYIYNWHFYGVTTVAPTPVLNKDYAIQFTSTSNSSIVYNVYRATPGNYTSGGNANYMIIPQIWNPHDANTPAVTNGPTQFRVVAETTAPSNSGISSYWQIRCKPTMNGGVFDGAYPNNSQLSFCNPPTSTYSTAVTLSVNGTIPSTLGFQFASTSALKQAFREPTLLWRNNIPNGMSLSGFSCTEASVLTGKQYFGIFVGNATIAWTNTSTPPGGYTIRYFSGGNWASTNATSFVFRTGSMQLDSPVPGPSGTMDGYLTFRMEYYDGTNWVPYQEFICEAAQTDIPGYALWVDPGDFSVQGYNSPLLPYGSTSSAAGGLPAMLGGSPLNIPISGLYDPRTPRFGAPLRGSFTSDNSSLNGNPTLDATTMNGNNAYLPTLATYTAVATSNFVLMATQRPSISRGQPFNYHNPSFEANASNYRFYTSSSSAVQGFYGGLLSQNNPSLLYDYSGTNLQTYYEDADGICRRAMGAYVPVSGSPTANTSNTNTTNATGLPLATAGTAIVSGGVSTGLVTPTTQSRSRPIVLHRPLKSVAEMSYAFRGTAWKNIDFFTPESGDSALLDVFCVDQPQSNALVAGKVNINSRQAPVLQSLFSGSYFDEWNVVQSIDSSEASSLASNLLTITTSNSTWRGPLSNVSEIVGRYVSGNTSSATGSPDVYQYTRPSTNTLNTFSGFSAMIGNATFSSNSTFKTNIQRFREAAIRALADTGQTRVWNLMVDVVAQVGTFPPSVTTPPTSSQFIVQGEKRYWVSVAIDRITGKILDQQIEPISE